MRTILLASYPTTLYNYVTLTHEAAHARHDALHRAGSDVTKVWLERHPIARRSNESFEQAALNYKLLASRAAINPFLDENDRDYKNELFRAIKFESQVELTLDDVAPDIVTIRVGGISCYRDKERNENYAQRYAQNIATHITCLPPGLQTALTQIQHHPGYPNSRIIGCNGDEDFLSCAEDIATHTEMFSEYFLGGGYLGGGRLTSTQKQSPDIYGRLETLIEYEFLPESYRSLICN